MATSKQTSSGQGLAIAALSLGIITIVTSLFWIISVITGTLAIIFGAVSVKSAGRKKAIAGIITGGIGIILTILFIVVVLLAVPALQKSQRDTARKNDVSSIMSDIVTYQSNNRGALPSVDELFGGSSVSIARINDSGEPTTDTAVYLTGVACDDSTVSARDYSVRVVLENGSTYCQDS